ncbi:helix-turn-helix transcriptional regulator, partial [Streptococcus pneumoniae]|nr:helix-turn-helix transcriptional regulator [Streptococcus pneumoniae]
MIEKMELGEFYKELRLARKLKQTDVACEGLTASQLSKFELGQSMLSADKLILAIQGINVTFDEFGHKLNNYQPQLFTPNLKTIQNPCLSLDPGWFLFSPNGCFLLDKKEFPLYGISVEKNTKRKETHMNSLPNHHFQNKSFYQ